MILSDNIVSPKGTFPDTSSQQIHTANLQAFENQANVSSIEAGTITYATAQHYREEQWVHLHIVNVLTACILILQIYVFFSSFKESFFSISLNSLILHGFTHSNDFLNSTVINLKFWT